MTPTTLSAEHFWKLRALQAETQLLGIQIRDSYKAQEAKVNQAFSEAGLDIAKVYNLDEATLTATPKE